MKPILITLSLILLFIVNRTIGQTTDVRVKEIRGIVLPGLTITEVEDIPSGNYTPPGGKVIPNFPAFIRVSFISKPTSESNIHSEIWLPKDTWNGRYLGTGNGGGAGGINYGPLVSGVLRGFATANTDMGTSPSAQNIIGYPERWADFGYRSTHEMTIGAKAILKVYYKKAARYSYFVGCSTGGQQSLMEAQRYPDDYDGIIAGAPANNRTHLHACFLWNARVNIDESGHTIVSEKKMKLLSKLVIQNYVGKDGGAPGDDFLTDPRFCKFNLDLLPQCPDELITDSCFSNTEIKTLKKLYAGPINPRTSERIYSPFPLGETPINENSYQYYPFKWVFGKDFDYKKFDFDADMAKVDSVLGPILNANNPDLDLMKKRGGKILMFTGTDDQIVPYQDAINYYDRVIKAQHGLKQTQDFFRYFLVPGMGHCGGGKGLNEFGQGISINADQDGEHDIITALINWVEKNIAPQKIIATSFNCCDSINKIRIQRPLYPYPKFPNYMGGNPTSPSSFQGVDHPSGGVLIPAEVYLK